MPTKKSNFISSNTNEQARGGRKDLCWRNNADSRGLQAQKFINAYAAFLKRQGKLPIPGMNLCHPSPQSLLLIVHLRLGWYCQDRPCEGTPSPIHRLVLRPRRFHRSSRIPQKNCWCWSSPKSPRFHPQPWFPPISPCRCLRICRQKGYASSWEDWCVGAGWGQGRTPHYTKWTAWFGSYCANHSWGWGGRRRWRIEDLHGLVIIPSGKRGLQHRACMAFSKWKTFIRHIWYSLQILLNLAHPKLPVTKCEHVVKLCDLKISGHLKISNPPTLK